MSVSSSSSIPCLAGDSLQSSKQDPSPTRSGVQRLASCFEAESDRSLAGVEADSFVSQHQILNRPTATSLNLTMSQGALWLLNLKLQCVEHGHLVILLSRLTCLRSLQLRPRFGSQDLSITAWAFTKPLVQVKTFDFWMRVRVVGVDVPLPGKFVLSPF